jgi:hypothetical protein
MREVLLWYLVSVESLILQVWEVCPEMTLKEEKGKKPARKNNRNDLPSVHPC